MNIIARWKVDPLNAIFQHSVAYHPNFKSQPYEESAYAIFGFWVCHSAFADSTIDKAVRPAKKTATILAFALSQTSIWDST